MTRAEMRLEREVLLATAACLRPHAGFSWSDHAICHDWMDAALAPLDAFEAASCAESAAYAWTDGPRRRK
jgi:hypothetical protein